MAFAGIAGIGGPELVVLAPFLLSAIGYYILVGILARAKGRGVFGWLVLCTITGPLGLIVLLCLPGMIRPGEPKPSGDWGGDR